MKPNFSLTESDKKVIKAFVAEKSADSRLLQTDGRKLEKHGLGSEVVARWTGGRISIVSTESVKSDESIIRFIVKTAGPGIVDFSYARKGHRTHGHGAMGRNPALDEFTQAFFETALWSTNDESDDSGGEPLDKNYSIDDIDPTSLAGLTAECARFQEENADDLAVEHDFGPDFGSSGRAGHDFWLTRCGHGAGFWDGDWPEPQATRLTEASEKYGNVDLYVGDDGVIYASGYEAATQTPNGSRTRTDPRRGDRVPSPKFKAGDRVVRDDGSARGDVAIVGNYDDLIGGYRYKVQQDDGARIYWNESSVRRESHTSNGPRTGILSDGTRVNVYHKPGTLDEYTVVPHSEAWDSMERGGMRSMLGTSSSGRGFSQWTEGQEGRHLGRKLAWQEVPDELKRHIESRVVDETMVANAAGIYKGTPVGKHDMVLHQDHRRAWRIDLVTSASGNHTDVTGPNRGYGSAEEAFQAALDVQRTRGIRGKSHVYIADRDGNLSDYEPMESNGARASRSRKVSKPETLDQQWDKAEQAGLVREIQEPEIENYFDVYGYPDSREEREQIEDLIQLHGLWMYATQYLDQETGQWQTAESVGMVFGNDLSDPDRGGYGPDFKRAALQNVYGGHTPNARGSAVDEHAATELSLYIENEYSLIGAANSIGKSIDANLRRKIASGKYDSSLAPKAWAYLIEAGAKKYSKDYSTGNDWSKIFSAATRRKVAEDFARAWEQENIATR